MTIAILLVTVHLANLARLPHDLLQAVAAEAGAIWAAAGTEITWAISLRTGDAMMRVRPDLNVILATRCSKAGAAVSPIPIAAIHFFDGRPTSRVCVSLAAANALLDRADSVEPRVRQWALRQRLLARMLGRALAHEIGHYLFASADHAPRGLMKARHTVADLVGDSLRPFSVETMESRLKPAPTEPDDCGLNVRMFDAEKEL